MTVNNEEIFWPMNHENVLKKIDDMFNDDYCFSADELPSLRSDDDTQINISWRDEFKFKLCHNIRKNRRTNTQPFSIF